MLAEVARGMGIPFEILYGTLYAEMALDTSNFLRLRSENKALAGK
ncbi:MAG: hypothetical protein ACE5E7_17165 [Anaerolineae bacterium]